MDHNNEQIVTGGKFYIIHERDGNVIEDTRNNPSKNKFINEGLKYALNLSFSTVNLAGSPTIAPNLYVGLTTISRVWTGTEIADNTANGGIHTIGGESEDYDELGRQEWVPQLLATTGNIELNNVGAEATFTMNVDATIYGAFIIDNQDKTGLSDTSLSILIAGSNFVPSARTVFTGDVLKIGYTLSSASA